jgi:hypothetical protein
MVQALQEVVASVSERSPVTGLALSQSSPGTAGWVTVPSPWSGAPGFTGFSANGLTVGGVGNEVTSPFEPGPETFATPSNRPVQLAITLLFVLVGTAMLVAGIRERNAKARRSRIPAAWRRFNY